MYPTIYHVFLDLFGLDWSPLKFLNSFGFFVAIAFILASWTLGLELRRMQALGIMRPSARTVTVGLPASVGELIGQFLLGFLLGWKGLYLVLNLAEVTADPPGFLLSGTGNFLGGIAVGGLLVYLRWREKDKAKLPEPRQEEVKVMPHEHAGNITIIAAIWGFIGAKTFHWLENPDQFMAFLADPMGKDIISGLTMYGGLIMAGAMVIRYFIKHGIPAWSGADAAAPGVMLAYAVGRIGCHVSGDGDWGIVNNSPAPGWIPNWLWSYDYPNNVNGVGVPILDGTCYPGYCTVLPHPVYPTSVYETIMCFALFAVLWTLRKRMKPAGTIFLLFLFLDGLERFFIEKIRVNVPVWGTITQAEIIATLLMIFSAAGLFWLRRRSNTNGPQETH
ncbi:MAG: prolipoprotein diacylglyceryl transferase [Flavobacteriales bacterium]|nr:prolipoprotein diacylglyceryl transferase [Flavobacteriales bacterium]